MFVVPNPDLIMLNKHCGYCLNNSKTYLRLNKSYLNLTFLAGEQKNLDFQCFIHALYNLGKQINNMIHVAEIKLLYISQSFLLYG
jgi:hypothetical protein